MTGVWVTIGGKVYEVASFGEMTVWGIEVGTRKLKRMGDNGMIAHHNYEQAVEYLERLR